MRVLLTGAAGFIGSRVRAALLAAGHEVVALDALLPAAHGAKTCRTPNARSAHMLARYGTLCAGYWWSGPWRGKNATSCWPTTPTVTGALGSPKGVSRLTVCASESKNA